VTEAASSPGGATLVAAPTPTVGRPGMWNVAAEIAAAAGATDPETAPVLRCCPNPLVWDGTLGWVHLATGLPLGQHTSDPSAHLARLSHTVIAAALRDTAKTTSLRVTEHPELPGASLAGPWGEAYLLAKPHGVTVELWREGGDDAYRVERHATVQAAVTLAVTEVTTRPAAETPLADQVFGPAGDEDCPS